MTCITRALKQYMEINSVFFQVHFPPIKIKKAFFSISGNNFRADKKIFITYVKIFIHLFAQGSHLESIESVSGMLTFGFI